LEANEKDIPDPLSKVIKIVIDKDKHGYNSGVGYCSTAYRPALIALIRLHKKVWIKGTLKTYLSGYVYDDDFSEIEDDTKVERWALNNPDYELMIYRKKKRLQK
jgi:hypothetical protein